MTTSDQSPSHRCDAEEMAYRSTVRTQAALVGGQRAWIRTGFDLQLLEPSSERRFPVCYSHMTLGSHDGPKSNDIYVEQPGIANRQAIFKFIQNCLYFSNLAPENPSLINGIESTFRQVNDGDEIQIGPVRIQILELRQDVAYLEGYSEPHRRSHWSVGSLCRIGRLGKRHNHVELLDETVSREHATIETLENHFALRVESGRQATWINGEVVDDFRILQNEDLIQLGQQLLRFRTCHSQGPAKELQPKVASILFADMWDYAQFSESRPLEQVIGQINEMYKGLGKVASGRKGQLMTYLGDAMMVLFEGESNPTFSVDAVQAALDMHDKLELLNQSWLRRGYPAIRMGIGIATGEVMIGDVGATEHREFAAMGDTTNVAARIEKLTRLHDAKVLICHTTAELVYSCFQIESLGETELKGRRKTVGLYSVVAPL